MANNGNKNSRKRPWLPLAILLGGLLIIAVAVSLWRFATSSSDEESSTESPSQPENSSIETQPDVSTSSPRNQDFAYTCQSELSTDQVDISSSAPEVDEWVSAGYNVVPSGRELGGCHESDSGLRLGYAKNEAGALFAATNYAIGVSPSGINAEDRLDESVAEGPDKTELLAAAESISKGQAEGANPAALRSAEVIGYDLRASESDSASFTIYLSFDDDSNLRKTAAGQVDLVWLDGDWKVNPASGQTLMTVDEATKSPSVRWGGQ